MTSSLDDEHVRDDVGLGRVTGTTATSERVDELVVALLEALDASQQDPVVVRELLVLRHDEKIGTPASTSQLRPA